MQVKEIQKHEASELEQESSGRTEKEEALEGDCGQNDLNFDSVIDVSGQNVDFPLFTFEELNVIPRAVGRLKGLRSLKFFSNEMHLFPVELKNLVTLECLQVHVCCPGWGGLEFSKLEKLEKLELIRHPQRAAWFPRNISELKCLRRLSICHVSIRYLPAEIGYLDKLEHLDLSFNKMRNLPDEICSLRLLISLKIPNNKLTELPCGLSNLHRLEELDLAYNRLTSLDHLKLESMHNLKYLNFQHNQLYGSQIPTWICCNLEGNIKDLFTDESAEMDVNEGVIQDINYHPCHEKASLYIMGSASLSFSHLGRITPSNQCLAAQKAKGWKRHYNLRTKARQERLKNCKKWKVDSASQNSFSICTVCRISGRADDPSSKEMSVTADAELDCKDQLPGGEMHGSSIVFPRNDDFCESKDSVNGCPCSVIDSDGMQKEVDSEALTSTILDDSKVLDDETTSEASNCVLKFKRHYERDIDNPKPPKSRRPIKDSSVLSCQYKEKSFCGAMDYLPDGFYDAGRDRPFMPLLRYHENLHINSREVILLDRERDEELDVILFRARRLVYHFTQKNHSKYPGGDSSINDFQVASLLALFVSDHFGGSDRSSIVLKARKAVSGSNYDKPFICTCATGMSDFNNQASGQGFDPVEDISFLNICEQSIHFVKGKRNSPVVPIGDLQFGVCRHRALLFKYLCDRMEPQIPCELVRGYLDFAPHAWNIVIIKNGKLRIRMIFDACHPHDVREESDPEYFSRYVPLNRVCTEFVVDPDAGPNCSFPSISVCDEDGKQSFTTLNRCKLGTREAAVKVRTFKASGASAGEVRNFELCCLGEIRLLSLLKHPCIVEYYGHQMLSNLSVTDPNSGNRTFQSAILMEYIKGGSLKSYLEKLSTSGENRVPVGLALSIARDVASALTELHSKHIIHRDIKSENILVDFENRQDGTPVVKICDFDRAIPLHSYLHTCCIAHIGVHPPGFCVGTPRWMAPEVFQAMNERVKYGLEVDIWSFGCLLLELLTLQVPYFESSLLDLQNNLKIGRRPRLTEELVTLVQSDDEVDPDSETLRFLVKLYHKCTKKHPADRPSAEEIYNSILAQESASSCSRSSEND